MPEILEKPVESIQRDSILDPQFLGYLEQLGIVSKKIFLGRMRGERRTKKRGVSIEFADYRDYSKGDDLRFLDWNIFGRLDRLFTKLFHEEEDLYLYIVIDTSLSMDYGDPNKMQYVKKIAAALAYITLAGYDRVCMVGFSDDQYRWLQPTRGKALIRRIVEYLENLPTSGATVLYDGCKRFVQQQKRGGVVVLLSDLLDPNGFEEGVKQLLQRRNDVYLIQTMSPQELEPDLVGDLKLIDVENEDQVEISMSGELLSIYERRLKAFQSQIKTFSHRYGIQYMPVSTGIPIEKMLAGTFRRLGLIE